MNIKTNNNYIFDWLNNNHPLIFLMRIFHARVVGGAVRNSLLRSIDLNKEHKIDELDLATRYFNNQTEYKIDELDLATRYSPDQMIEIANMFKYKSLPTGIEHGTVTILNRSFDQKYKEYCQEFILTEKFNHTCQKYNLNQTEIIDAVNNMNVHFDTKIISALDVFEITTLRFDKETDGRHAIVEFTTDWKEDAARRDFTINALYVDHNGNIYDYFSGIEDLKTHYVRFIGDPEKRIQEDYLRIFRFFRFNAIYGKEPFSDESFQACKKHSQGLEKISQERLWKEWIKILDTSNAIKIITLMQECNIFNIIKWPIPNLEALKIRADKESSGLAKIALFDGDWSVAKPSNKQKNYITSLRNISLNTDHDWLEARYDYGWNWIKDKMYFENINKTELFSNYDDMATFALNGTDLQNIINPGPEMGLLMKKLKRYWIEHNMKLDKHALLIYAKQILKDNA